MVVRGLSCDGLASTRYRSVRGGRLGGVRGGGSWYPGFAVVSWRSRWFGLWRWHTLFSVAGDAAPALLKRPYSRGRKTCREFFMYHRLRKRKRLLIMFSSSLAPCFQAPTVNRLPALRARFFLKTSFTKGLPFAGLCTCIFLGSFVLIAHVLELPFAWGEHYYRGRQRRTAQKKKATTA